MLSLINLYRRLSKKFAKSTGRKKLTLKKTIGKASLSNKTLEVKKVDEKELLRIRKRAEQYEKKK